MDTELIITFAQQKTYWLGLTMANWISIVVAAITFGILAAALVQWRSSWKAHKLSHKPIIRSDFRIPNEERGGYVKITNSGLGPALMEEINIYIKGEKLEGIISNAATEAIETIAKAAKGHVKITHLHNFQQGYPISGNESKTIIKFEITGLGSHERFEKELHDQAQFEVIYKDIFGEVHRALDPQLGKEL